MRLLDAQPSFKRAYKRWLASHPELKAQVQLVLQLLAENDFDPKLETHKLKGRLKGYWACTTGYDLRIVFIFTKSPVNAEDDILLVNIGTHNEVYE
jgi:addiction module RelE/StbE family toxin